MSDELVLRLTELAIDAGMDICVHYHPHKMVSFKHPRVPNNTPQKYGQESLEKDRVFEQMFRTADYTSVHPDISTNVPIELPAEDLEGDPNGTNGDVPFVQLTEEEEAAWKDNLDFALDRMAREREAYFASRQI